MGGKKPKKGLSRWHIILLICVFVLAGLYLFEANSIVKDRFALEATESYIQGIRERAGSLEIGISETNALHNLELLSAKLNLEEVKHISYIEVRVSSPLVLSN